MQLSHFNVTYFVKTIGIINYYFVFDIFDSGIFFGYLSKLFFLVVDNTLKICYNAQNSLPCASSCEL